MQIYLQLENSLNANIFAFDKCCRIGNNHSIMFDVIKVTIKEQLEKRKISLYRLSKDTGVAYSTLWKLNTKRVNSIDFDVLFKICDYLNCTPNDLLAIEK